VRKAAWEGRLSVFIKIWNTYFSGMKKASHLVMIISLLANMVHLGIWIMLFKKFDNHTLALAEYDALLKFISVRQLDYGLIGLTTLSIILYLTDFRFGRFAVLLILQFFFLFLFIWAYL
jgi:hypothetical protein